MTIELNKEYRISKAKRITRQISAFILFALGTLPSLPTSIILRSVLPLFGGIFLAFLAYCLYISVNQTMLVNSEGILLKNRKRENLLKWSDIREISQGQGIHRHEVTYTLVSDGPSSGVNFGLFRLACHRVHYLPDTFGTKAQELAVILEQIRKRQIQYATGSM